MSIAISKWGNSAGVRIPSLVLKKAGLSLGDFVQAEVTPDGAILIRSVQPVRKRVKVDIHALLAGVTPENLPDVSAFETTPVGTEIW